jgi:hypothetical protein
MSNCYKHNKSYKNSLRSEISAGWRNQGCNMHKGCLNVVSFQLPTGENVALGRCTRSVANLDVLLLYMLQQQEQAHDHDQL